LFGLSLKLRGIESRTVRQILRSTDFRNIKCFIVRLVKLKIVEFLVNPLPLCSLELEVGWDVVLLFAIGLLPFPKVVFKWLARRFHIHRKSMVDSSIRELMLAIVIHHFCEVFRGRSEGFPQNAARRKQSGLFLSFPITNDFPSSCT
jgi:hypothetical protein